MLKKIKYMSISMKILSITLGLSLISQGIIGLIGYINMKNIGKYSFDSINDLGEYAANDSESALKNQAENYTNNMAFALASSSNKVLENVSNEVSSFAMGLEIMYQNNSNFKGYIPPLPNMTTINDVDNRNSACEKAYVIDSENISQDKSTILVYDPGEYPAKFSDNIYKTDILQWNSLSDEEKNILKNSKSVVSNNPLPENLKNELQLISNIFYLVSPIYSKDVRLSKVYLGTNTGIYYEYSPNINTIRYDPKDRPWYIDAVNAKQKSNNQPIWQSSYLDIVTNKPCVTCSKAFCDSSGNILGVVSVDMFLTDIYKYLINSKIGNTGYSFIIDKNGKVVLHPDYITEIDSENFNINGIKFDVNLLEQNLDESYRNAILNMTAGKNGTEKIILNDKNYYISYSPLSITGWSLAILTEIDDIIKPATDTKSVIDSYTATSENFITNNVKFVTIKFLITILIFLIVITLLAIIVSKRMVKPIENLIKKVRRIGQGDLNVQLSIETYDEIGELSQSFNKMTLDLKKYIKDLSETTAEKERIHNELVIAKKIQFSMLPCIFPAFPDRDDFDIYAIMDPAKEVGGDFYDFFFVDDENLVVTIADVSGKGVSGALFMVIAKILINNESQKGHSPAKILELVNNQLCRNNEADMFVTAFLGIFNIKTGKLSFANAGHNPPLIYRAQEGHFEWIKCKKSFVLAGYPNIKYQDQEIYINPNDVLYLYTDGVTESLNKNNDLFGEERLKHTLDALNMKEISIQDLITILRKDVDNFSQGVERSDDITMLALKNFKIRLAN